MPSPLLASQPPAPFCNKRFRKGRMLGPLWASTSPQCSPQQGQGERPSPWVQTVFVTQERSGQSWQCSLALRAVVVLPVVCSPYAPWGHTASAASLRLWEQVGAVGWRQALEQCRPGSQPRITPPPSLPAHHGAHGSPSRATLQSSCPAYPCSHTQCLSLCQAWSGSFPRLAHTKQGLRFTSKPTVKNRQENRATAQQPAGSQRLSLAGGQHKPPSHNPGLPKVGLESGCWGNLFFKPR